MHSSADYDHESKKKIARLAHTGEDLAEKEGIFRKLDDSIKADLAGIFNDIHEANPNLPVEVKKNMALASPRYRGKTGYLAALAVARSDYLRARHAWSMAKDELDVCRSVWSYKKEEIHQGG
jgi:hypothetical protein